MFSFIVERPHFQALLVGSLGVWLGLTHPLPSTMFKSDWLLLISLLIALGALSAVTHRLLPIVMRTALIILLLVLSHLHGSLAVLELASNPLADRCGEQGLLVGKVASLPKHQGGYLRFKVQVRQFGDSEFPGSPCFIYLKSNSRSGLVPGDQVFLEARIEAAQAPANRGQFDLRRYLARQHTLAVAYCDKAVRLEPGKGPMAACWRAVAASRSHLITTLGENLPPGQRELAVSVVFGDKITDLPSDLEERFRRAGLTHILVASGTQVSLLIALLGLCFWKPADNLSLKGAVLNALQFLFTTALVLLYGAITGFDTSILRAVSMGLLLLAGKLLYRDADGLSALALSGLLILFLNPAELLSPSFQLSYVATFGLIYTCGAVYPMIGRARAISRSILQALAATGGAQIFTAPLLMVWFKQISLASLGSNLLAVPAAFLLLIFGGAYSLGLAHIPVLGQAILWVVQALVWVLDGIALVFGRLTSTQVSVPAPPAWWQISIFLLILLCGELVKTGRNASAIEKRLALGGAGLCAISVVTGVALWLIPAGCELTALALRPGKDDEPREAYIWRPGLGATMLVARSAGLERQHNGDTVADALAWRGVNSVSAVIWLDEPPAAEVCRLPRHTWMSPGADLPDSLNVGWILYKGEACGLEGAVGGARCWCIWDADALAKMTTEQMQRCDALMLASGTWRRLDYRRREALSRHIPTILVQAGEVDWASQARSVAGEQYVAAEATIGWQSDQVTALVCRR